VTTGPTDLFGSSSAPKHRDAIVTADRAITWEELREAVISERATQQALSKRRVGLIVRPTIASYVGLLAFAQAESDVFLMDGRLSLEEAAELGRELRLSAVLSPGPKLSPCCSSAELPGAAPWSGGSTVTILTSGSTGKPKAVQHGWAGLCRPVRRQSGGPDQRWLQTYRPNLYAGLQVLLQCFLSCGTLLVPREGWPVSSIIEFAAQHDVECISATPSYWRKMLISCDPSLLRKLRLKQITLGGEVVDQPVLENLKRHFPTARITHIYATTELGRCFAVKDGVAGFPMSFLEKPSDDGIELKIVDGELFARSANAMNCYDGGGSRMDGRSWFATGDLVEVVGERARFVGRKSEMINVGGNKVYPVEVERVIRAVPGVTDVRVFARASSIAGQLVACEIVADPGRDTNRLKNEVRQACNANLAEYQLPRLIAVVDHIELSPAQKMVRSGQ
jgi:acyl-CoA synthetase (AMP-forming)/AMP-acid ligase II